MPTDRSRLGNAPECASINGITRDRTHTRPNIMRHPSPISPICENRPRSLAVLLSHTRPAGRTRLATAQRNKWRRLTDRRSCLLTLTCWRLTNMPKTMKCKLTATFCPAMAAVRSG